MAGCYGNDPEDRYFENKLLNHLDEGGDMAQCQHCNKVMEQGTSDANNNHVYCSAECENDAIILVMDCHDILDAKHLDQILLDYDKLRAQCDDALADVDEIRAHLNNIVDQIREK